ncbi:Multidrug resistance protein NorM [Vibrio ruber DSM 16370]|uniref:Multidrug resistance protein NorM n=1 Tax=Vibrio ruber (strain DSM 16370 / JCM 11486 / BCRC 17186 / CECT 7878 / LMG 23124 / VR1) TaxID=1123498 RepID=A0A1R4LJU2_VIBR1|nr:MATE family efflux transporter [Vibrio ruber]SJN56856.1 Multidrug resistance protein NorM [Vibrio ruber DSM 16370]
MHLYKAETKKLFNLAVPVLIASVAQTGMGFVDTVMAGGASAVDMAAVAVAGSIWMPTILFGMGILMALVPVIAQLNGSGKQKSIPYEIQQGIYTALLLTIPTILILFQTNQIMVWMDIALPLAEKTRNYMYAMMFGAPAFLLFQALRNLTDGMSMTKPAMVIGFLGLLINIPLNWIFVYGKFGAPALGGVGCGVATAIVYWTMFLMLCFYVMTSKRLESMSPFRALARINKKEQIRIFKLGLPVSAAFFFEVSLFAVVALLVAKLGATVVAAHQIAVNFSSMVFMLPMSIGAAVSIRVGHKLGEDDFEGSIIASKVGIGLGLSTAVITAALTILFREQLAWMYTDNLEVIALAAHLLFIAAIYQCTDSIQVVSAGALRGYKDMKSLFYITFIAYWLFGLPFGCILAFTNWIVEPMGVAGFWVGFIIGLSAAALMLGTRLVWIFKQHTIPKLNVASS